MHSGIHPDDFVGRKGECKGLSCRRFIDLASAKIFDGARAHRHDYFSVVIAKIVSAGCWPLSLQCRLSTRPGPTGTDQIRT